MYSLILTLIIFGSNSDRVATSVTVVDGFRTKEACLSAANLWVAQAQNPVNYARVRARAACVSKS